MKKLLLMMGIFILVIGGVVALTSLISNIKIEKVGDTYTVYEVKDEYKENDLLNERKDLIDMKRDIEKEKFSCEVYLNNCLDNCNIDVEMEIGIPLEDCVNNCDKLCFAEEDLFENQKKMNIIIMEGKISDINDILEIK